MDISSLVRAVIAAFDDATKLVQRIRDQRMDSDGMHLPEEATRDLLESLALGPIIVRGHFEHDIKRFGEPYACGDIQAREQLKDVLINLQMSLIINLRTVYMDGIELDFLALQTASDDCRVNAGVCLGQLSQRLSDAMKAQAFYPQTLSYSSSPGLLPPLSPSLGYSSSRSTHSSAAFPAPRTPDAVAEQFGHLSMSPSFRPPVSEERKLSVSSGGSQEQYLHLLSATTAVHRPAAEFHVNVPSVGVHRVDEADTRSLRRRSSQALAPDDNILLMFPQPGGQPVLTPPASAQDIDRESNISTDKNSHPPSSPDLSRASSGHQSRSSRDRFGPDDYGDHVARGDGRQFSNGTIYDMYQPTSPERQASASYSSRAQASNHSSLEHVRYLQENSRPPRREPRSDSLGVAKTVNRQIPRRPIRFKTDTITTLPREFLSRPSVSGPIPIEPARTPPPTGPLPPTPVQSQTQSVAPKLQLPTPGRAPSVHTLASSTAPSVTPLINTGPVVLPTDKNLLGFCKGAFRLQAGLERKAFTIANRPHGLSGMTAYWRCEKCNFEGPVYNTVNTSDDKKKRGKPERIFDPRIRVSEGGGIRYRWAFLARCHVSLKGIALADTPSSRDGSFGSFGCIFCCVEGKSRGWLDLSRTASNVTGSTASIKSGHGNNNATKTEGVAQATTPIFGNVSSFMQHLENVHRHQDGWPNAEMVGRFRVVVDRTAPVEEAGWEVNFVPF
ncbi:uncharacterized protein Z520_08618 [Fonsecaea multimorphosa CBS 102226]|uniref:Uncharacterized protein n=1 Tax=Fonsecaea multimorphosa CBS 102226 TaxID=1442371 RepID=A0A0D2KFN9_9EURO|nr:uncharacterized protein Z520_08618 [Fonsecaea multimorphosa CBS 102226]KIX95498.1 hypothetical protein Z520_08618 [Fonsecaea multimorphosa CBS 102226]OAL21344.1 hypothetical protein AYO22_08067 [Fonsecaea multimorphosa]